MRAMLSPGASSPLVFLPLTTNVLADSNSSCGEREQTKNVRSYTTQLAQKRKEHTAQQEAFAVATARPHYRKSDRTKRQKKLDALASEIQKLEKLAADEPSMVFGGAVLFFAWPVFMNSNDWQSHHSTMNSSAFKTPQVPGVKSPSFHSCRVPSTVIYLYGSVLRLEMMQKTIPSKVWRKHLRLFLSLLMRSLRSI